MKLAKQAKVIIRHCGEYEVGRIRAIVREGLEELDLKPSGRTLLKPNIVGSGPQFQHAYTRPEVAEAVLLALQDVGGAISELAVGERCGITMPTRYGFAEAGYDEVFKRMPTVRRYLFEEEPQVEIPLTHAGRLRDYVFTPEPVARADFFVNMPKFKAHPWTTVTFSLKNYIGIQDDRHRLIDHDHRLNDKIADLQHIIQPQFICVDGIISGQGRMMTPDPFDLKLLVMGNNQVALDATCCRIIGLDPRSVDHIRLVEDQGFGPTDPDKIELSGDVSLEDARKRTEGYEVGLIRVEKYFEGTNITAYAGPPPEKGEYTDYCWGGCPGAIEEAIEILRQFDDQCDAKMPRTHVVFGAYEGPIHAGPGEMVLFIGDCTTWQGTIAGKQVTIPNVYRERKTLDPHEAKHDDIYAKLVGFFKKYLEAKLKRRSYIRLRGCPVSVSEQLMALATTGGVKNPVFDPSEGVRFNKAYFGWRLNTFAQRLRGQPYQRPGRCHRGNAAPELD